MFERHWLDSQFQLQPPIRWMTLFIIKKQLQQSILSNLMWFCRTKVVVRSTNYDILLVSGMCILKEVCYFTISITATHFFYGSVIISREHLKRSICQGHGAYFKTLVATIHDNERSVVDLKKFQGYVYLRTTIVALLF